MGESGITSQANGQHISFADDGRISRTHIELEASKLALANSLETTAFLESVLNASKDCIKVLNPEGQLIFMNNGGRAVMEVDDFEALRGQNWVGFWTGEDAGAASGALEKALSGGVGKFRGFACTAKGTRKFWDVTVSQIASGDGAPPYILSISRDITVEKAAEDAKHLLNLEMQHRVKNLLAVAQAIGARTFRDVAPVQAAEFGGRMAALARAQDLLLRGTAEIVDLSTVIREGIEPLAPGHQCILNSVGCEVDGGRAFAMALAVHELGTNALKYGALSTPDGHVEIELAYDAAELRFEWRESGGPPAIRPTKTGFGTTLITRNLEHAFAGEVALAYEPSGLSLKLVAPLQHS